jgi:hypothetical protein
MDLRRRDFIRAGIGMGAAMLVPSSESRAQAVPLLQKKIPSSGESIPSSALARRGAMRRLRATPKKCR